MPFSRTTATRVPAGTVILSLVPMRLSTAGRGSGATGGGANVCGPSDCCAKAKPDETKTNTMCRVEIENVRFTGPSHDDVRCAQQRYGCLSIRLSSPQVPNSVQLIAFDRPIRAVYADNLIRR